jgi:hypothetical protein
MAVPRQISGLLSNRGDKWCAQFGLSPCKTDRILHRLRFLFVTLARFYRSRRDLPDHVIVLNAPHLKPLMKDYVCYYQEDRTHLALAKGTPIGRVAVKNSDGGDGVISTPRLGGLHRRYDLAARYARSILCPLHGRWTAEQTCARRLLTVHSAQSSRQPVVTETHLSGRIFLAMLLPDSKVRRVSRSDRILASHRVVVGRGASHRGLLWPDYCARPTLFAT